MLDEEERLAGTRERLASLEEVSASAEALAAERQAADERQQLWLTALQHAVWDWDVARGTVHWSARCAELFGVSPEELTDSPAEWVNRVHPEDRVALSALLAAQLGGASGPLRIEHRVQHAPGEYRWVLCEALTLTDDAGVPARLLGALVDVTERKERELALVAGVLRDPTSGLPNRASVLDRLGTVVTRAHRGEADAAVAVLRALPGVMGREDDPADGGPAGAARALGERLEAVAQHGDVVGHLGRDVLACAFVDLPGQTGAARLAAVLEDLPGQQRRTFAVGTLPSVRPFDDPADAVRAAEAVAARDVPGVAR